MTTKVAVFGCLHGQLNDMFNAVELYENQNGTQIDLIIVCGDCQTIRHQDDLRCLAVPNKYKRLGDFHEYYSGAKKVPRLTVFVGGNHEASNYLMTLPYGGWVCDNFYYLGFAGVIKFRGLKIGGVSGIYNYRNCNRGRFERLPFDDETMRSIYHTRRLDVFRLSLLAKNTNENNRFDAFLSHDWPARVYEHGDLQQLLRFKPHFRSDVESRSGLGSPMTRPLIEKLKPRRWFAAHLHCKFQARIEHDKRNCLVTEFLSLNKIEKGRHFVEYLDLTSSNHKSETTVEVSGTEKHETDESIVDDDIYYDEEWLTILRKTVKLEYKSSNNVPCPNADDIAAQIYFPTDEEIQETKEMMENSGGLKIKKNFCMAEPVIYDRESGGPASIDRNRVEYFPNPQHVDLCTRLGIDDKIADQQTNDQCRSESFVRSDRSKNNHYVHPNAMPTSFNRADNGNSRKRPATELDEDGCLPYFVDKKGEPLQ